MNTEPHYMYPYWEKTIQDSQRQLTYAQYQLAQLILRNSGQLEINYEEE